MSEPIPFDIEKFENWLRLQPGFTQASLHSLKPLSQDGSGRVFWRLWLKGLHPHNSDQTQVVYIEHPLTGGPVFEGDTTLQAHAFIEVARVLGEHKLPVPRILAAEKGEGKIVLEDIGDTTLASCFKDLPGETREKLEEKFRGDWLEKLFQQGLSLIVDTQKIEFDTRFIGFRRRRAIDLTRIELSWFLEYYGAEKNIRPAARDEMKEVLDSIAEELTSLPKTLSFYDYNCFNLFVDERRLDDDRDDLLRILDFQDMSLNTPARDVFSLLNDRGVDDQLGKERQHRLIKFFLDQKKFDAAGKEAFMRQYYLTALHWDFKVSGQFIKLNRSLGTDRYSKWIPSTMRRLGRTLVMNQKLLPKLGDALDIVIELSDEAKEGSQENWRVEV